VAGSVHAYGDVSERAVVVVVKRLLAVGDAGKASLLLLASVLLAKVPSAL
jgi:hypothetical protein